MNPKGFWTGDGGDAYTQRNRVDWRARIPFWQRVLSFTGARSVFEFGCNAGWNLSAIRRAYPDVALYGCELNGRAGLQASRAMGHACSGMWVGGDRPHYEGAIELVFTAGVLIHISPADLEATMCYLINQSARYVLAIEYDAPEEQEIEYRGERGLLWKRPYGKLYEALGLALVTSWGPEQVVGFDQCTAWLLKRR